MYKAIWEATSLETFENPGLYGVLERSPRSLAATAL